MDFQQVLIYILGFALLVLLLMSITFVYILIKVMKNVRQISDKAEHAAENMMSFSEVLRKSATPAAVSSVIGVVAKKIIKNRKGGK